MRISIQWHHPLSAPHPPNPQTSPHSSPTCVENAPSPQRHAYPAAPRGRRPRSPLHCVHT
eukprot:7036567-Prymnesium_polylepis.1